MVYFHASVTAVGDLCCRLSACDESQKYLKIIPSSLASLYWTERWTDKKVMVKGRGHCGITKYVLAVKNTEVLHKHSVFAITQEGSWQGQEVKYRFLSGDHVIFFYNTPTTVSALISTKALGMFFYMYDTVFSDIPFLSFFLIFASVAVNLLCSHIGFSWLSAAFIRGGQAEKVRRNHGGSRLDVCVHII